jgi:hypothetical protein
MSDEKEIPKESPELKEDELKQVTGGAVDIFLKLDDAAVAVAPEYYKQKSEKE